MSLLLDEIHVKPYFDYNGGNTHGIADISNASATSYFAFMISSVFLGYKDVMHIMPNKCLKLIIYLT